MSSRPDGFRPLIIKEENRNYDFVDEFMYVNVEILFLYFSHFTIRVCFIVLVHKMTCLLHQTISFLKRLTNKAFKTMIMWGSICKFIEL